MSRAATVARSAVLIGALVTGCRGPQTTRETPASAPEPEAAITGLLVLETLAAHGAITAADLCPPDEGERLYDEVSADDATAAPTGRLVFTGRATDRYGATLAMRCADERTEFWRHDDDGTVRMPAVLEHRKAALTRFDPPLLVAPATLDAGETVTSEASMRVLDARRPSRTREAGRGERTIRYVEDQRIRTPRGEAVAKRVVIRFTARLRLARAERETVLWIVPGRGIVAQDDTERITVLGLPVESTSRRLVMVEAAKER